MADEAQNRTTTYICVLAVILYFGSLSPWQSEQAERYQRLKEQRDSSTRSSALARKAGKAKERLQSIVTQLEPLRTNILNRATTGLHVQTLSREETFDLILGVAVKAGLPETDVRPLDGSKNDCFTYLGCSFGFDSCNEEQLIRFIKFLYEHESKPFIRKLEIEVTNYSEQRTELSANFEVTWVNIASHCHDLLNKLKVESSSKIEKTTKAVNLFGSLKKKQAIKAPVQRKVVSKPKVNVKPLPRPTKPITPSSLTGLQLLGVVSANERDGIVTQANGKEKIVLVGQMIEGATLKEVSANGAVFLWQGKIIELKLQKERIASSSLIPSQSPKRRKEMPTYKKDNAAPTELEFGIRARLLRTGQAKDREYLVGHGIRRVVEALSVSPGSRAAELGFQDGDYIFNINDRNLTSSVQLKIAGKNVMAGKAVSFHVLRQGKATAIIAEATEVR